MDKRIRVYYRARFDCLSHNMRIWMIKASAESVKLHSHRNGFWLISCLPKETENIEYELRKAQRRDGYCDWVKL